MASASVLASRFLPWDPTQSSLSNGLHWVLTWSKHLSQLFLVTVFYHSDFPVNNVTSPLRDISESSRVLKLCFLALRASDSEANSLSPLTSKCSYIWLPLTGAEKGAAVQRPCLWPHTYGRPAGSQGKKTKAFPPCLFRGSRKSSLIDSDGGTNLH